MLETLLFNFHDTSGTDDASGTIWPRYAQPLDVGVEGRWWDLAPLRLDRAVPLRDARPGRVVGIYTLHADGEFVYVGQSASIGARLVHHRRHAGQWVDRIRVAWLAFEDVAGARRVERMIAGTRYWLRPEWNRTGYGSGRRSAEIVEEWFRLRGGEPASRPAEDV